MKNDIKMKSKKIVIIVSTIIISVIIFLISNIPVGFSAQNQAQNATISKIETEIFGFEYLNEALKAFTSSEITLNFAVEIRPFVIKGNLDQDLLHLILPVRID